MVLVVQFQAFYKIDPLAAPALVITGLFSFMATSFIVMIPVVALFLLLSRWLVSGLTLGSVKG